MKLLTQFAIVVLGVAALHGQTLDSSGNNLLNGAFHFRQVAIWNYDQNGYVTEIRAAYGTITFDGAGNYSVTGSYVDNTVSRGAVQTLSVTGTYVIGANGTGYIANPLAPTASSDRIYGAVAQGVFTGSTTEEIQTYFNDLLVAIPAGAAPTNASFTGSYWTGVLDFTGATDSALKNAMFQLTGNGQGGLGTISLKGQNASLTTAVNQTVSGATYNFGNDGTATLTIPLPSGVTAPNALFAGSRTMYVSADGNFVLGWTAAGYDIFVGVRALSGTAGNSTFTGLYFTGALDDTSSCGIDSYAGSALSARGDGNQIVHQRLSLPLCNNFPLDFVSDDQTQINADGTVTMPDFNNYVYGFGAGGQAFVAVGTGGVLSLVLGLHSNNFSGTGVYLNPIGIYNAFSYAPITAALAPGELITLFGSGLANSTPPPAQGGQPFPTTLGGVQVTINGTLCPIYFVSPGQISVIVPYGLSTASLATIQVTNNGTASNAVTMYLTNALPGVATQNQAGYGLAAAVHPQDGSLITGANPAQPGEVISMFLTGLGTVTPTVQDGALGGTSPLNNADLNTSGDVSVYFNDYGNNSLSNQATISYAGLAPGLAGLYQLNVQVPAKNVGPCLPSTTTLACYAEIIITDPATGGLTADVLQVQVPVAGSSAVTAASRLEETPQQTPRHRPHGEGRRNQPLRRGPGRPVE
jgi:uncharacterized protein (TIGR03437 family)